MIIPLYNIAIGNITDIGKIREQNEDYMAHFDTLLGYCIIVCDGMGGHAAGHIASQNAIIAIQQFLKDPKNENNSVPVALKNAIEFANFQLREMVVQNPALSGMGTTCVLALIKRGLLFTAHAGDSRIYLIRKGLVKQITKDHSSVQKLIDIGVLTEEEAELSNKKNEILKAIGIFEKVDPTITEMPIELHKYDKLLLCSDGLTGHVSKEEIAETVLSTDDIQKAVTRLVEMANEGGGTDNITVQLVNYTGKTITNKKKLSIKKLVAVCILLVAVICFSFWMYKKNNVVKKSMIIPIKQDTAPKMPIEEKTIKLPARKKTETLKDKKDSGFKKPTKTLIRKQILKDSMKPKLPVK